MPPADSQTFLRELDKNLWTAADRLRSNPNFKGVLDSRYTQLQIGPKNRAERVRPPAKVTRSGRAEARINLSSLSANIPFQHAELRATDILGLAPGNPSKERSSSP